jgi:glutathione synthase/RimK-type ligase-like ATP-grasp enzyme
MPVFNYDIVLLTQKDYIDPPEITPYIQNVLTEDELLTRALEQKGLNVIRTFWDNEAFPWHEARFALFRATWDYFHRFTEFHHWLERRSKETHFINPYTIIRWNMDKHYLGVLQSKGVNIPPTLFLEKGAEMQLNSLLQQTGWNKVILKPAIAGAARHTYLIDKSNAGEHEVIFRELIANESMLLQEFQEQIVSKGEVSFMVFGGKYSHSVLKRTKPGDFRVQDDFGGSLHPYTASKEEINFVEQAIAQCDELPVYARVDVMWDNNNQLCLSELEMIEPELWFRKDSNAAHVMADAVCSYIKRLDSFSAEANSAVSPLLY